MCQRSGELPWQQRACRDGELWPGADSPRLAAIDPYLPLALVDLIGPKADA